MFCAVITFGKSGSGVKANRLGNSVDVGDGVGEGVWVGNCVGDTDGEGDAVGLAVRVTVFVHSAPFVTWMGVGKIILPALQPTVKDRHMMTDKDKMIKCFFIISTQRSLWR